MATSSGNDINDDSEDDLDGFGGLFEENATYSTTSNLQSTLGLNYSTFVELGETCTSSIDDIDGSNGDEFDGFGGMFDADENYSSTCNLHSTLKPKVSTGIGRDTHCTSSIDDIDGSNGDEFDGFGGMFDADENYSSTCNLHSTLKPKVSTGIGRDTYCCSRAISVILKCCTSLSNIDLGCCRSLKTTCADMKKIYKRYYLIIRMAITSLVVCAVDQISDIWTSVAHFERCDWMWGTTSALLVILPLSWIAYTLIKKEMWNHDDFKEKKMKIFLVICAILQVLVIYWFIWKARKWWTLIKEKKGKNEDLPKTMLRKDIFQFKKVKAKEGLLEGGLQLSLQIYILLKKIRNYMMKGGCSDNCNNTFTSASSSKSFSKETCIDYIQIGSIVLSLLALSYSQAFVHQRQKTLRKITKFVIYIQTISVRMFIPAVLAAFDNKCKWYLAPAASLICYSILHYIRTISAKRGYKLPKVLEITQNKNRDKILGRSLKDVLYWGLNHMLFNVSSVSGLAISFPFMISSLPYVRIQDAEAISMHFYYAAAGLSTMCVLVNIVFVIWFREYGKKIIALSSDN